MKDDTNGDEDHTLYDHICLPTLVSIVEPQQSIAFTGRTRPVRFISRLTMLIPNNIRQMSVILSHVVVTFIILAASTSHMEVLLTDLDRRVLARRDVVIIFVLFDNGIESSISEADQNSAPLPPQHQ